jgi:hypothetical protein
MGASAPTGNNPNKITYTVELTAPRAPQTAVPEVGFAGPVVGRTVQLVEVNTGVPSVVALVGSLVCNRPGLGQCRRSPWRRL